MHNRSIEMLQALAKSARKFTRDELLQLFTDVRDLTDEALLSEAIPPKSLIKAHKVAADPFVKLIDQRRRRASLPAREAVSRLTAEFKKRDLGEIIKPAPKTLAPLIDRLRTRLSDDALFAMFDDIAKSYEKEFSAGYDLNS